MFYNAGTLKTFTDPKTIITGKLDKENFILNFILGSRTDCLS